tara:strand:+ start:641 stop:1990 length:1350 start_codon:yes stop_codon:yes gene_type:complete
MANTYLTKTFVSGGSITKWTYSVWLKRSKISYNTANIFGRYQSASYFTGLYFSSDDGLQFLQKYGGSNDGRLMTADKYRDTSGWYHIVAVWDSANSTADDRMKLYVNGVSPTIINRVNATQNRGSTFNTANPDNDIGRANGMDGDTNYFDGLMSHIHFCDGYAYSPTDFGETDATTGEWKIKTSVSVSYGTTGFNILKDGNSVTDTSPNSNNFTVGGGTLTKTEDCPDNVFATMNSLDNYFPNSVFANGNNSITTNNNARTFNNSTIGMTSGKYYCEMKSTGVEAGAMIGIIATYPTSATNRADNNPYAWQYINGGTMKNNGSTQSGTWASWVSGDILGIALDLDNNKIWFSKNGVWQNTGSANPSTGTDGFTITAVSSLPSDQAGCYFFNCQDNSTSTELSYFNWNFGNGYFGTTAVASAGTNASGIGIFEYDVPTGFTALSTKGLNS